MIDFVTLNSIQSYGISKVRNFYFTDGIKLTVQKNSLRIAFIGNIDIHNSKSLNSYFKYVQCLRLLLRFGWQLYASLRYTVCHRPKNVWQEKIQRPIFQQQLSCLECIARKNIYAR